METQWNTKATTENTKAFLDHYRDTIELPSTITIQGTQMEDSIVSNGQRELTYCRMPCHASSRT